MPRRTQVLVDAEALEIAVRELEAILLTDTSWVEGRKAAHSLRATLAADDENEAEPRIIWWDEGGDPDSPELAAWNAGIHIERMDDGFWWIGITAGDESVHFHIAPKNPRSRTLNAGSVWPQEVPPIKRDATHEGYSRAVNAHHAARSPEPDA